MNTKSSTELETALEAIKAGGNILKKYFNQQLNLQEKTDNDFVTIADKESEQAIIHIIKQEFPEHNIIAEETGTKNKNSEYSWIIDPLDGTFNYSISSPIFGINIALLKNNKPILGAIYMPLTEYLVYADENTDIQIENINQSKVNKGISFMKGYKAPDINIKNTKNHRIITHWAPSVDFILLIANKLHKIVASKPELYDVVAGLYLAKKAGFKITNLDKNSELNFENEILDNFEISRE